MSSAISILANAIGYPESIREDLQEVELAVDEGTVKVVNSAGRLRLERVLLKCEPGNELHEQVIVDLAGFAAGRILREDATIAWEPDSSTVVLWQDVPASLPPEKLKRFFEVFMTSCDWWIDRVAERMEPKPIFPEMVIMP